ncbi:hypothetical protein EUX98_g2100 [Antrodiella citrinella]|uniref:Protein kinase domain-containing protein n=1 Tax=Antrodiella citrinella TaxID=2447956 RepID=A0A4S4MZT6_9APHY|nr:hypothetical protein EUX98_g2100 [Antrodiella citrinella]
MVLPWMDNGTIIRYIELLRERGEISEAVRSIRLNEWLFQIASGLAYLHSEDIVHGALRGSNILIDSKGNALLTDFGMARIIQLVAETYATMPTSAIRWQSPELLDPDAFQLEYSSPTIASDMYSFALTCIELVTMKQPFSELTESMIVAAVISGKRPERPTFDDGGETSEDLWTVISDCWEQNPSRRPNAGEVVYCMASIVKDQKPSHGELIRPQPQPPTQASDTYSLESSHFWRWRRKARANGAKKSYHIHSVLVNAVDRGERGKDSVRTDETICASTIFGIDVMPLLAIREEKGRITSDDVADIRMQMLLCRIGRINANLVFNTRPRLQQQGFRWAPQSLLGGIKESVGVRSGTRNKSLDGVVMKWGPELSNFGLQVKGLPGLAIDPLPEHFTSSRATQFHLKPQGPGLFYYTVTLVPDHNGQYPSWDASASYYLILAHTLEDDPESVAVLAKEVAPDLTVQHECLAWVELKQEDSVTRKGDRDPPALTCQLRVGDLDGKKGRTWVIV